MADVDMHHDDDDFLVAEETDDDDEYDSGLEDEAPTAKVLKDATNAKKSGKTKNVEETYQKLTPHEHILKRPDTYIGSVEPQMHELHILAESEIIKKKISLTPGMYKIFDEIVVNAADNKQRDPNMSALDITIVPEECKISVRNNGKGIPIVKHQGQGVYVPTLIFGHLLTGSNFDDDEKKTTGGRNGYGAKLANIFSTKFIVDCVDTESGQKFQQVFTDNMKNAEEPIIKKLSPTEKKNGDFVQITFYPDLARFKMTSLDPDIVGLMSKRAYDIAGSLSNSHGKKMTVTLNGNKLPIKSFKDYLGCFAGMKVPTAYQKSERWEVGCGPTTDDGSALQHISFVNGICTSQGGEHVNYIANQVITHLQKVLKKKNKGTEVSKTHIRNHLFIFCNCLIENPAFSSQTKEQLTTRAKAFGSTFDLSPAFLKAVEKSGVVDEILSFAKFKQNKAMKRLGGVKKSKLTGIPKLDDANHAGTAKSAQCTLILTEGDSAKSLAMSGLSVVGRDFYGVFPLKGKPLNVREASQAAVVKNEEIKNLVDIMGLKFGTQYSADNVKTLRYGHLMIMADQDHDGSHIKGLIINILHYYWPGLLDIPGFLQQFITPIVKATKGKKSKTFFTLPEYETWRESPEAKGYKIKYYKGLGTSTAAEAKEYFSNLTLHEVHFGELSTDVVDLTIDENEDDDDEDMDFADKNTSTKKKVTGTDLIDMLFAKSRVEDRKTWLNALQKDTFLDYSEPTPVNYSDFVNKEFILFSQADNQRSIPHMIDGFKPSQRKVLFSCFKRKLKAEIKVAQLAGYVSEHSAYHHGEASLTGTIINMAQNFCGSNNINLLVPSGQFGTRRMGGKDSASPRYVFTKLEEIARLIYHPDDDPLLTFLNDDGLDIEPEYYVPVIPTVLINGSEGIGTGWSSNVPNYSPRAIVQNLRNLIAGKEMEKMDPWYHGFHGEIVADDGPKRQGCFKVFGKIERTDDTTLMITELPIKKWTQDYKIFLESMMNGDAAKKIEPEIKDFKENHTDATVSFTITADAAMIDKFEKEKGGLIGKFKLSSSLATTNMHLFDDNGRITKYTSPEHILQTFFDIRLDFYSRRKELLLVRMRHEQLVLKNKARFIEEVCAGTLVVSNRKRADILADLQERGYDLVLVEKEKKGDTAEEEEIDDEDEELSDAQLAKGYEYLLGMKIWSLTYEKAQELRRQLEEKILEVQQLEETAPSQIWLNDLDAIEVALDERDAAMAHAEEEEVKAQNKNKKHQAKKSAAAKKKKKKDDWDSDEESEDDLESSDDVPDRARKIAAAPKASQARKPSVKATSAATRKPSVKAPAKRPSQRNPSVLEKQTEGSMTDDDEPLSLAERMKQKLMVSPPMKRTKPRDPFALDAQVFEPVASLTPAKSKEAVVDLDLDDSDQENIEPEPVFAKKPAAAGRKAPAAKKPAAGRKAPAAKKPAAGRKAPAAKKPAATVRKTAARKAPATKKKQENDSNDDSDDFLESEGEEAAAAPLVAPRAGGRRRAAAAPVTYALSSDSETDYEDDE